MMGIDLERHSVIREHRSIVLLGGFLPAIATAGHFD
jgi:hypothetical protein